ncbi:helix-turn-helix transcriptional regulator [[Clostridium] symbiosum]|uniref:helix-turn-helix domain-containing protein n=1 Tax=Clostridium symbiosum TaxID=1512 RepID=UPI001D069326|nr:helix-turn-helix transcriptional regulator [[Clostridium] symbiosum]MCB6610778.1 helix-turn-helix domain-containing protein [[Clostridium] symbiosum]MCB6931743.1 helix-turn-helix domain-containing protein [[Clostridium] symbiosum]
MNQKKIGSFISEVRREKGMTQAELAEKLGVTNKTVSRWETGNYMPDLSTIQSLCTELDIGVNEFISGERLSSEAFREHADNNVISVLNREAQMLKEKRISDFLSGGGTGLLLSALSSANGLGRTVVTITGLLMIFTGWYFRSKLDKRILSAPGTEK